MALQDRDRSQLERQILGDIAALIAIREYLQGFTAEVDRVAKLDNEIRGLIRELWP